MKEQRHYSIVVTLYAIYDSYIYYLYLILFHLPRGMSEVGAVWKGYWQSL
jgi:hypothetical protein